MSVKTKSEIQIKRVAKKNEWHMFGLVAKQKWCFPNWIASFLPFLCTVHLLLAKKNKFYHLLYTIPPIKLNIHRTRSIVLIFLFLQTKLKPNLTKSFPDFLPPAKIILISTATDFQSNQKSYRRIIPSFYRLCKPKRGFGCTINLCDSSALLKHPLPSGHPQLLSPLILHKRVHRSQSFYS